MGGEAGTHTHSASSVQQVPPGEREPNPRAGKMMGRVGVGKYFYNILLNRNTMYGYLKGP